MEATNDIAAAAGLALCGAKQAGEVLGLSAPIAKALARAGYLRTAMCDATLVFDLNQVREFSSQAVHEKPSEAKKRRRARKSTATAETDA